jgi:hypothetical protein
MREDIQKFLDFLHTKAVKKWSETMNQSVGLKIVSVSGFHVRAVIANDQIERFWELLTSQLPKDATLYDLHDGEVLLQGISNGTYCDMHSMIFASQEWPVVGNAEPIPSFEAVFNREDFTPVLELHFANA